MNRKYLLLLLLLITIPFGTGAEYIYDSHKIWHSETDFDVCYQDDVEVLIIVSNKHTEESQNIIAEVRSTANVDMIGKQEISPSDTIELRVKAKAERTTLVQEYPTAIFITDINGRKFKENFVLTIKTNDCISTGQIEKPTRPINYDDVPIDSKEVMVKKINKRYDKISLFLTTPIIDGFVLNLNKDFGGSRLINVLYWHIILLVSLCMLIFVMLIKVNFGIRILLFFSLTFTFNAIIYVLKTVLK